MQIESCRVLAAYEADAVSRVPFPVIIDRVLLPCTVVRAAVLPSHTTASIAWLLPGVPR